MAHFPDTETEEFSRPYLVMYRDGEQPWHVRSERGWVSTSGDVILLLGKVHIWRNTADGELDIDIKTEDLRVLRDTDYGETDQHVTIETPRSVFSSVGMRAYLDQGRLELLDRVKTVHRQRGM